VSLAHSHSFLNYALHYVILRTLYDGARGAGVSAGVLVVGAVVGLMLLGGLGRFGVGRARVRREARWREESRLDARRRWRERNGT
jgi:hypothetical protein